MGLCILGGEIVVTVTPPLETLTLAVDHLLVGGFVGTVLLDEFEFCALICCDELKRVILLCNPPTYIMIKTNKKI